MGHCRRSGRSISNRKRRPGSRRKDYLAGTAFGSTTTTFFFSAAPPTKKKIRFIECPLTEKFETPYQERALSNRKLSQRMKRLIVAIFLCIMFSAIVNAAQRKIAYDRDGK